jgi:hypothetical protein
MVDKLSFEIRPEAQTGNGDRMSSACTTAWRFSQPANGFIGYHAAPEICINEIQVSTTSGRPA